MAVVDCTDDVGTKNDNLTTGGSISHDKNRVASIGA